MIAPALSWRSSLLCALLVAGGVACGSRGPGAVSAGGAPSGPTPGGVVLGRGGAPGTGPAERCTPSLRDSVVSRLRDAGNHLVIAGPDLGALRRGGPFSGSPEELVGLFAPAAGPGEGCRTLDDGDPLRSVGGHHVELRVATATGARDLVDSVGVPGAALRDGHVVLFTHDQALAAYAAQAWRAAVRHLDWSVSYTLVVAESASLPWLRDSASARTLAESLARDAVRVSARAAAPPYSGQDAPGCRGSPGGAARTSRVAYSSDDAVARDIAERLVATAPGGRLASVGLPDARFAAALQNGSEFGFVVAAPQGSAVGCDGQRTIPLIDIRWMVVELPRRSGERAR